MRDLKEKSNKILTSDILGGGAGESDIAVLIFLSLTTGSQYDTSLSDTRWTQVSSLLESKMQMHTSKQGNFAFS